MAFMQRDEGATSVVMDVHSGRPLAVRVGAEDFSVRTIVSVRDETLAYSAQTGPRTVFRVEADGRSFRLVHRHQARDWSVEALDSQRSELASAA
jgi:hypothetical protein